jgi:heme-degrading monooxygenase HmoA
MPTTQIAKGVSPITLINVFSVKPEQQDQLVRMLNEAAERTMRHIPGFVSASIHKSLDGQRVVNYAQWRSKKDFEAMFNNPQAAEHIKAISAVAAPDAHLYEVSEVYGA